MAVTRASVRVPGAAASRTPGPGCHRRLIPRRPMVRCQARPTVRSQAGPTVRCQQRGRRHRSGEAQVPAPGGLAGDCGPGTAVARASPSADPRPPDCGPGDRGRSAPRPIDPRPRRRPLRPRSGRVSGGAAWLSGLVHGSLVRGLAPGPCFRFDASEAVTGTVQQLARAPSPGAARRLRRQRSRPPAPLPACWPAASSSAERTSASTPAEPSPVPLPADQFSASMPAEGSLAPLAADRPSTAAPTAAPPAPLAASSAVWEVLGRYSSWESAGTSSDTGTAGKLTVGSPAEVPLCWSSA